MVASEKLVGVRDAAERIGVSRQLVTRWIREGKVAARRFGIGGKSKWMLGEPDVRRLEKVYRQGVANVCA